MAAGFHISDADRSPFPVRTTQRPCNVGGGWLLPLHACRIPRHGLLLTMHRRRPSRILGLVLLLLNLTASVLPAAAHAAAHHEGIDHAATAHVDHHEVPHSALDRAPADHDHTAVEATPTQVRPTVELLPAADVTIQPVQEVFWSQTTWTRVQRPLHLARTHDPPSAPRAPPSR